VSTMKTKDGVEQPPRLDAAALLECRSLAATALLLVGIGFWQHYTGYVEAEQRRDAGVTTASESASGSNIGRSSHRLRTAWAGPVPWEQHPRSTSKPWLVP
jgi:hypothetical protein